MKNKLTRLSPLIAAHVNRPEAPAVRESAPASPVLRLARDDAHHSCAKRDASAGDVPEQCKRLLEKLMELITRARLDASGRTDSQPLLQTCIDKTCGAVAELLITQSPRLLKNPRLQKLNWIKTGGACTLRNSSIESVCRILEAAMEALATAQTVGTPSDCSLNDDELAVIRENLNAANHATNDPDFAPTTARLTRLDALSAGRNQYSRRPKHE